MTPESGFLARIAAAEGHIRNARKSWNPVSLAACADCAEHLQQAIDEMKAASESAVDAPGAQARFDGVRAEVEELSRLVDAAIAFSRGLALQAGDGPLFSPEGRSVTHV